MDLVYSIIATVFGLFVALQFSSLILIAARLVKLQLWAPTFTTVPRTDAAEELPYLDAAREVLEQEGFQYVSTRRVRSMIVEPSILDGHVDVYYHPDLDVHAETLAAGLPNPRVPFDISLLNTYADGSALLTVNGLCHYLLPFPKYVAIADGYVTTFALQLAHHLAEREKNPARRTDPAEAPALAAALANAMLPEMERSGSAYAAASRDGEPVYAMSLFATIKLALRMRSGAGRRAAMQAQQRKSDLPPESAPEVRLASERHAFVRSLLTLNSLHSPRWFRWSAFVVSAAAFIGLGAWWWGLSIALVLGAVVALHEGGHWLAMRLAGFRNVQVFFVPGMGAATSGEKHGANPLTHLAVYLAGPMPGLLLAMGGIAWMMFGHVDSGAWWYPTFIMAIGVSFVLNLLNLAPVMPFDGGRVVDLFVFGRLPWCRFAFGLASGAVLLGLGFASGDKVVGGLGLLSFIWLPHYYRIAKVSRDLLRQGAKAPVAQEEFRAAAGRLFDFLAQSAYAKWSYQAKMNVGRNILPRFLGRLPDLKEALSGVFIYVICCVAPLALLAAFALSQPRGLKALLPPADPGPHPIAAQDLAAKQRARNEARLAAASGPVQRLEVLNDLFDDAREYDEVDEEVRLARLLYATAAWFTPPSSKRADAAYKLALALREKDDKQSTQQIASLLSEAEHILRLRLARKDDGDDALSLAQVIDADTYGNATDPKLAKLQEIVELHAAHRDKSGGRLLEARTALARALDEAGRSTEAENQLTQAQFDARRMPQRWDYSVNSLALNHAWFLVSSHRPQDAVRRIAPQLAKPIGPHSQAYSPGRDFHMLAAIAARSRGDWRQVQALTTPLHIYGSAARSTWLASLFRPKLYDLQAGLLLVEAKRQLGHDADADKLVSAMRGQYVGKNSGTPTCSLDYAYDSWRKELAKAVGDVEKREFKCQAPPPPLMCPVPAATRDAGPQPEDATTTRAAASTQSSARQSP